MVGLVQDTSSLSVILATTGPLTGAPHRPRAWSKSLHALASTDPFFEGATISICRLDLYERMREILGSHGPHAHDLARERLSLPAIDDPAGKWLTRLREGNRVLVCNGHRHVRRLADFMRALLPPSQSESILVLPLLSNGRVIGAFWIEGSDPAKHSTERMQLLETLGNCLSLALDAWVWRRDEEQRDSVLRETLESHEREKQRIALDVHDGAVQTLASAFHHLQAAAYGRRRDEEGHRNALAKASSLLRETMQELRGLMEALRPATLDRFGLTASIESEVEDLREGGWDAQLEAVPLQLSKDRETALYRIIHEALTNIRKHAGACQVRLALRKEGLWLHVEVQDWGSGFDPDTLRQQGKRHGFGLLSMRKRAELVGGRFEVESGVGQGTRISLQVPLRRKGD